ncbi:DUF3558 domain-containing protein [Actinophytocola sediminis]
MLAAVLLAGCGGTSRGEPVAGDRPTRPTSSTAAPANGAPDVRAPLDASPFIGDPCAALSQAQLADLGIVRPGQPNTEGAIAEHVGPQCIWHGTPELDSTIDVGFVTGDKHGLGGLYAARETQEYFEETLVQGYPAVFHSAADQRAQGACNISVGISNTFSFRTSEFGELDATGSCARAKAVADAVITTLKEIA